MKIKRPPITADDLRKMGPEALENSLSKLSQKELEELQYMWEFWARDEQLEPEGNWKIWLALPGRGFGKTRMGNEWLRHRAKCGNKRLAAIAPTRGAVRQVLVEGESGLLNICSKHDKTYRGVPMGFPEWTPTTNELNWENGAKIQFFSAEDPERLRGPQFEAALCDELAAWTRMQETWDMLQFCLRLGKNPRICVTTTPKPKKLIVNLYNEALKNPKRIHLTTGSSYDNKDNIDLTALQEFEGSRLGDQELYGKILMEAEGALWNQLLLDECTDETITDPVKFAEDNLVRVVVAVDPATSDKVESDMTGIVVAGVDVNGTGYVLEDATERYSPQKWAQKAVELYYKYGADRIVAEKNQGGAMVKQTLLNEDNTIPLRMVFASRGKMARAEPVAAMYERGKVKHAPGLGELEQQMVTWEPLGSMGSPDRLDAMVWAITDLMLQGRINPEIQILYSK